MNWPWLTRRQRDLLTCAPINNHRAPERPMRAALARMRRQPALALRFARQQKFDRAVAGLVGSIAIPPAIADWFANEQLVDRPKRPWKKTARHPAILAIGIAFAVITGIAVFSFVEHLHDFPGAETARKLLVVASATRTAQLEPLETDAGELGDWFFMKYQLEHYEVPAEFADFKTTGARVFDDQDGVRVAQISVSEKRMQFFLFPARKRHARGTGFSGWKFVEQDDWIGAVQEHDGICFMAVIRGEKEDLDPYLTPPRT